MQCMIAVIFYREEELTMNKLVKSISAGALVAVLAASSAVVASAAGINDAEQRVLDELNSTIDMAGTQKGLPQEYINSAENYFNTIDLSDEQADGIIKEIKEVEDYLESLNVPNLASMTYAQIEEMVAESQDALDYVNLIITYEKPDTFIITDAGYNTVFVASIKSLDGRIVYENGDVNGDGITDIADALLVARYDVDLIELSADQIAAGDVNGDGVTDIADALMIARADAGLIEL